MTADANPVCSLDFRIPFHRIEASHVGPGIRWVLDEARERVEDLAGAGGERTYGNTIRALDRITERVDRAVDPVQHLMSVAETPELRQAWNDVLPEITRFRTWLHLHPGLWAAVREAGESEDAAELEGVHARHMEKTLREFRRAGADLPDAEKERLSEMRVELSTLEQRFSENVLDATADYELHVTDEDRLDGVPENALRRYRARAREQDLEGWLLTLDFPSYEPVQKYATERALREELHGAYTGRCRQGAYDNRETIRRILELRQEVAELLGYPHFPDYQLEEAMAGTGGRARRFVEDLVGRTRPYFDRDVALLREHAGELGIDELQPWDVAYVKENLRLRRYQVDDEAVRPYFPLEAVLDGVFEIARRVFGLSIREREIAEVWHEDVRFFDVADEDGRCIGAFYGDFFPRKEKRQGAWMNHFITGRPTEDGGFEPHLGFIAGNFTPPEGETPALLTHREVQTVFHEFGHLLHQLCSRVPVKPRAGLNVAWDWVEVPSQLMENWTWEREAVALFGRHHRTGEVFPEELFRRLEAGRRFMGGWDQMRQLSFGTLDLGLHLDFAPEGADGDPAAFAEERLQPFAPGPEFARRHNLTSFTHLFSGGYASGYYSYLWSEVLEADVFRRFREEGIFSRATGRAFVDAILARGDSAEPDDLFREFMGRAPDPSALIERNLGELGE